MYEICTFLSSLGQKMYGQKVLNILPIRVLNLFFFSAIFLTIPYDLFHSFFFRTEYSEMSLYWYYSKMVKTKY